MQTKNLVIAALIATSLVACNSSGDRKTKTAPAVQTSTPNTFNTNTTGQPQGTAQQPTVQSTPATQQNAGSGAVNPAHGQPGHRCDIAVGAPLNSAPVASPSITLPANTPSLPQTTTQPKNTGSVKLNPPHGEPGHDCSVQVGQPLKS